ncbi:MAG: hypothetical protein A2Y60_02965 [Chloroflexi bacterium RBG_13_54_9]|nr:MAG: hypothetical protein A2Y60_02965 [Chloroflexi bacterium RBG_13_54_9]
MNKVNVLIACILLLSLAVGCGQRTPSRTTATPILEWKEETPTLCTRGYIGGALEFQDGTDLHASSFDFIDREGPLQKYDTSPVFIGGVDHVTLEAETHKYWVRDEWLFEYGFSMEGGQLVTNCSTSIGCPAGRPHSSMEFVADGSSIQLDGVARFTPDCRPFSPANKYTYETEAESWEVTWVGWEGESYKLRVMDVHFLEFEYAPPGFTYVQLGYGWHEYDTLRAISPGKEAASQYEFGLLSGIEFPRQYDASGKAVFTMLNGDKVEVTPVPQGDRAEWKTEGLLFDFYSRHLPSGIFESKYKGIELYIPFERVKSVHWKAIR